MGIVLQKQELMAASPLLPQTKLLFQSYVDKSPTDPSTILSAMEDAERICNSAGQKYTVFTVDQQLYAIVLNIIWSDADRWKFFYTKAWRYAFYC